MEEQEEERKEKLELGQSETIAGSDTLIGWDTNENPYLPRGLTKSMVNYYVPFPGFENQLQSDYFDQIKNLTTKEKVKRIQQDFHLGSNKQKSAWNLSELHQFKKSVISALSTEQKRFLKAVLNTKLTKAEIKNSIKPVNYSEQEEALLSSAASNQQLNTFLDAQQSAHSARSYSHVSALTASDHSDLAALQSGNTAPVHKMKYKKRIKKSMQTKYSKDRMANDCC